MVLKTEVCRFSGLKIYPGHGMRLTKIDSSTFLFLNAKCKRLFNLRLRPAKLAWTTQYRKAHKKDTNIVVARKKKRTIKTGKRSLVGASLEVRPRARQSRVSIKPGFQTRGSTRVPVRMKNKDKHHSPTRRVC
uniref:TRASH domain-containing protein n=1 Tax=Micromonas pusilla TaxID=38833 RepID=A0A7S0KWG8_MICPS|mmetsp:Transcript_8088/g.31930  ORF Transcript_8088/g.31930 Transcript_8088/m.31930 type:complete len:133 (+) Transcript_8088:48-446(+)